MLKGGRKRWIFNLCGPKTVYSRKYIKRFFSGFVFGLFLLTSVTTTAAKFDFDKYEVDTGTAKRQTVLTGFFLAVDFADLAVVHIDGNDDLVLRVYSH